MARILVTGANGFAGRHMVRNLHGRGIEVVATGHDNAAADEISGLIETYCPCDLRDPAAVAKLPLDGLTAIINLAGIAQNNPNADGAEAQRVIDTNVKAHTVLYDRLASERSDARIVAVSSGAVYTPDNLMPITEESELVPRDKASAYILSKILMEEEIGKFDGLDIKIARPFNHTGPGQGRGFLVPDWAYKLTSGGELDVKWLNSWRDVTDVRNVVEWYARMALAEGDSLHHDVYNISSGIPRNTYDVVKILADELGKTLPPRPPEGQSVIYASNERISADTGSQDLIPIELTIHDFVEQYKAA